MCREKSLTSFEIENKKLSKCAISLLVQLEFGPKAVVNICKKVFIDHLRL